MRHEMESLWFAMKDIHYKRTINLLTQSIRDAKGLEDALHVALEMVIGAIHAETGSMWLHERFRDGRIYPKAVYKGADMAGVCLFPGEGIAGKVIESGKSVIIANCQEDSQWAGRVDVKTGFQTQSIICVPLSRNGLVFGCIQIINKTDGLAFDEKDLSFTESLALEIALLLERQGLLEDYVSELQSSPSIAKETVAFCDVFCADSYKSMDYQLRRIKEFSYLRYGEQQEVLRLAGEIRQYFMKDK